MKKLRFSICIPVYKGSDLLPDCLTSITKQGFKNCEIIIGEDTPPEFNDEIKKTENVIRKFRIKDLKYIKNRQNMGYPRNLRNIVAQATGDVVFLMGQDDILAKDTLQKTHDAFFLGKNIGAVTRPYFWYDSDITRPVRAITPPDKEHNTVLSVLDGEEAVRTVFDSLGQLSGLAMMRKYIDVPFNDDVFPAHIYPFAGILRKYKCVYLKDYTVAVRIRSSQARHVSSIYNDSPLETWVKMFKTVYADKKYTQVREAGIKNIATHYVGLIQLKNYAPGGAVTREIANILRYHRTSMFEPRFWAYAIIALLVPRTALIPLVDNYKKFILSNSISGVRFTKV